MKNIAIICEYNPMHNGHIHQINEIKKIYPQSNIIALMSGSFVQRGEPSILDKFDKSEIALSNGVDLILELPAIISLQSANYFSKYSIEILNKLNILDYISFGIETSKKVFEDIIKFILDNFDTIDNLQKKYIDLGNSFKTAYNLAIKEINEEYSEIISKPNITLAIQYVLTLKKLNSDIKYLPISRIDGGYNSEELDSFDFQSATTIRKLIKEKNNYDSFVPLETKNIINNNNIISLNDFSNIFVYKSKIEKISPENIAGYENGLLNLILNNFENNLEDTIEKCHNKRYSKSKLKRFVLNYLLDIKISDVELLNNISYIRPLGFNEKGRLLINQLKNNDDILIVNRISNVKSMSKENKRILEIDNNAYMLRNINLLSNYNKNYTYKSYKK